MRSGLVSLQFIVSMVLMMLAFVFSLQYSHMIRYNVGIERENILEVNCYDLSSKEGLFIEELEKIPSVAAVTSSAHPLFGNSHSCQVRTIDDVDVEIKKGERIGQGMFQKYLVVDNDNATGKRTGGFGSTDK